MAEALTAEQRQEALQGFLKRLQDGESLESVRKDFKAQFTGVDATEIAAAEQALIAAGNPVEEVSRLCDVHSALFEGSVNGAKDAEDACSADGCGAAAPTDAQAAGTSPQDTPGHPLNIMKLENTAIESYIAGTLQADMTAAQVGTIEAGKFKADVQKFLDNLTAHYKRKEDLLFPHLERHGITGPSKVMWSVDDENRAALKDVLRTLDADGVQAAATQLADALTHVSAMVFKEENILVPMAEKSLTLREWRDIAVDAEDEGYALCLIDKQPRWRPSLVDLAADAVEQAKQGTDQVAGAVSGAAADGLQAAAGLAGAAAQAVAQVAREGAQAVAGVVTGVADGVKDAAGVDAQAEVSAEAGADASPVQVNAKASAQAAPGTGVQVSVGADGTPAITIQLPGGQFTAAQLDATLNALPFDITFVDADNITRYFSHGNKRTFARPKSCLNRDVMMCHPPKSQPVVKQMIDDFRAGTKDSEEFWFHMKDQYVYVRYFAVRDAQGHFLGTMECTQDISHILEMVQDGEKKRSSAAEGHAPSK